MYKNLIELYNNDNLEGFSKDCQRYFEIIIDKDYLISNTRYMVFKISDNNKFKYASVKRQNGEVLSIGLSKNIPDLLSI
jgi:hypothetical protein